MAKWNFDPAHFDVQFSARHMMVATVRGKFTGVTGSVEFDPANPENASVEATIDASTLSTGMADRDGHLKSADFLNVEEFPTMIFKSTAVKLTGDAKGTMTGDLTIRDVTKPVTMEVEYFGPITNPMNQDTHVGFTASTKIDREDWGLTWNVALETGGVLVGKEIKIELDGEIIKEAEVSPA